MNCVELSRSYGVKAINGIAKALLVHLFDWNVRMVYNLEWSNLPAVVWNRFGSGPVQKRRIKASFKGSNLIKLDKLAKLIQLNSSPGDKNFACGFLRKGTRQVAYFIRHGEFEIITHNFAFINLKVIVYYCSRGIEVLKTVIGGWMRQGGNWKYSSAKLFHTLFAVKKKRFCSNNKDN